MGLTLCACADPPAPSPSTGWRLASSDGATGTLVYFTHGRPALTLACTAGSQVQIRYDTPVYAGPAEAVTRLRSGDQWADPAAEPTSVRAGRSEFVRMVARLPARAPVFDAFRRTGELQVSKYGPFVRMDADPSALAAINTFFGRCEG